MVAITMRRLLLFRHAQAERPEDKGPDRVRPLTPHGREDAARIGFYMANHAMTPDQVVISPAKRAQETWKYAAMALSSTPAAVTQEGLYNAQYPIIFSAIKDTPVNIHNLMVIGHNPGLHELALKLIASGEVDVRERLQEKMP